MFSAFNPSKCTHLEQWAADCAAPGEQSWTSCRSRYSNPQPWVTLDFKSNALSTRPRLRQIRIHILNYLEDWLILAQSEAVSTLHKTLLISHLGCLGLRVNFAKSILSPSQRVSFLGTVIDSVQMTATVSAERAMMIQRHAASFKEDTARPLKAGLNPISLREVSLWS